MEFIGVLFALFFAIMLTAIFKLVLKNALGGFWAFFILMFFISLAAGEWAAERGPSALGYYWAPGLIAAVVVALVLAAASSTSGPRRKKTKNSSVASADRDVEDEEVAAGITIVGVFFWTLIVVLFLIIIAGVISRL